MDLRDRTVLILGGSGLVGHAVARRLLREGPARIVLVALYDEEVRAAAASLDAEKGQTVLATDWGDVFLPVDAAKRGRRALAEDAELRALVIGDLLYDLTPDVLERSFLFQLFASHRPDAVVDCINTATAFAYQDLFTTARELLDRTRDGTVSREDVERHVLTLTMPQLIRHVQIITEAMRVAETQAYVKIGTSGTGGMGFNIPYTHSEERPSRTLLTKSAVAGAHSLLLFLAGRTPGLPATVEIKPTATIGWREIGYGPIRRKGVPIPRVDCPHPLAFDAALADDAGGWTDLGEPLTSVYIDVGENGLFARDEFETVTSLGSMELITPEEIADYVVMELQGRPTGRDIIAALDASTAGPTYRAGILRQYALDRLGALETERQVRSVGFEMLGPPRLTKNLYEAFICSRLADTIRALGCRDPQTLAREAAALIATDVTLRSQIVSVGLPVVVDGDRVYRGPTVIVRPEDGDVESAIPRGWVDLRASNCGVWIARAQRVVEQADTRVVDGAGSGEDWAAMHPDDPIVPARFAAWIFRYEDEGERIKR